jgi:hypothetical protein
MTKQQLAALNKLWLERETSTLDDLNLIFRGKDLVINKFEEGILFYEVYLALNEGKKSQLLTTLSLIQGGEVLKFMNLVSKYQRMKIMVESKVRAYKKFLSKL